MEEERVSLVKDFRKEGDTEKEERAVSYNLSAQCKYCLHLCSTSVQEIQVNLLILLLKVM